MKTLAFTGHRPNQLGGYNEDNPIAILIKKRLRELIVYSYDAGYRSFISGMALGVDQWACDVVIELKNTYPDICLIAAVPFASQQRIWVPDAKKTWQRLLSECNEIYVVDENPVNQIEFNDLIIKSQSASLEAKNIISKKLNDRNKWMVDRADCILAVWKYTSGGTGNCVQYAKSKNKKIIVYNPDDDTVEKYHA